MIFASATELNVLFLFWWKRVGQTLNKKGIGSKNEQQGHWCWKKSGIAHLAGHPDTNRQDLDERTESRTQTDLKVGKQAKRQTWPDTTGHDGKHGCGSFSAFSQTSRHEQTQTDKKPDKQTESPAQTGTKVDKHKERQTRWQTAAASSM